MSFAKPRFRRDLEVRPVVADGQSHVEVRDHVAGTSFLFYDFEYQVALAFDGLALEKVIPWVKLATGLSLQVDQLQEFAQRLDELGFLEREPEPEAPVHGEVQPAEPRKVPPPEAPPPDAYPSEASETEAVEPSAPDAEAPTSEEPTGPPEPETVVMRPSEVVGETPTPVTVAAALPAYIEETPSPSEAPIEPVQPNPEADRQEEPRPAPTPPPASEPEAAPAEGLPPATSLAEAVEESGPQLGSDTGVPAAAADAGDDNEVAPAPDPAGDASAPDSAKVAPAPAADSLAEAKPAEDAAALSGGGKANAADSPSFPVLPIARPVPIATPPLVPPPWATPRPIMTPAPTSPSLLTDQPAARRRTRRSLMVFGTLGVLAAAALLAVTLPFLLSSRRPPPVAVRTVSVTPGTVYRYFDGAGSIAALPGATLKFPAAGKVTRIVGKGSTVAAGDVIAAVEAARGMLDQLDHQRERLAYARQMAEGMHQVGNSREEEQQLARVEGRKARIDKILHELASVAVVATGPGEVDEAFVHEGQAVEANGPALRLHPAGFLATFELPRSQAATARRLGFCQVEVQGYLLDCSPMGATSDEARVTVELSTVPPALLGRPAHLARARMSGAVVLPITALRTSGNRDEVFVVSASGRLEARPVVVADRDAADAIVVQGLDPGDRVVASPGQELRPGMPVAGG